MTPDPARARFYIIAAVRLAGAVAMMVGFVIASGRWASMPMLAGIAIVVIGAFGFAVAPRLLARRWKSPE